MTAETIDRSKKVTNYLRHATDAKQILAFNKFKKDFIKSTVDILSKKIRSINNTKQLTDAMMIREINTNANRRTTGTAINRSQILNINREITARAMIPHNSNRGQNLNNNKSQNLNDGWLIFYWLQSCIHISDQSICWFTTAMSRPQKTR